MSQNIFQACEKMGKIRGEERTYACATVDIWPPETLWGYTGVGGGEVKWVVQVTYDITPRASVTAPAHPISPG
jgi:hypothetical protein